MEPVDPRTENGWTTNSSSSSSTFCERTVELQIETANNVKTVSAPILNTTDEWSMTLAGKGCPTF
jgi:hypothetical protein